jgi:polyhydroxyalkanoate synthase
MTDTTDTKASEKGAPAEETPELLPIKTLEEMQHWTWVMGRAQQLMMEYVAEQMAHAPTKTPDPAKTFAQWPMALFADPGKAAQQQIDLWTEGLDIWQRALGYKTGPSEIEEKANRDKRFASEAWRQSPVFDLIRQSYVLISDRLLGSVDEIEGLDEKQRERLRFATETFVDAMSPSNFAFTNPEVIERTIATKGENLLKGLEHMLHDLSRGQLTQTNPEAFEVGRNVASTPGKVIKRTRLYELVQYAPSTDEVYETPLVILPPWINRFYILDLNPKKSFVKWAVDQGLTTFMVSWKSADESLADISLDDYVQAQIDVIDTVCELLKVEEAHVVGYCVAGTTLAATLAVLEAREESDKVASATFLTAQVDFSEPGELNLFIGDEQMQLIQQLSADNGFLDGRYMAATFNMLRGRELIWNYVINNYLLGEDYAPFDMLYWNSDTTNLPAKWHLAYLRDFYRDNKLVKPGGLTVLGTPVNLTKVKTPSYVQAGREDHIAPPQSVWKITHQFQGPMRFVLAGSGHIAGVVNPPVAHKYHYWTNATKVDTLTDFLATARESKGSWWPDWLQWIDRKSDSKMPVKGARIPGKGKLKALTDAPGRYVREH